MMEAEHQRPAAVVVDDDAFIRLHAAGILEDAGFTSLEATNGDEAVVLLAAHHASVQLLFTDVQMPGSCDGFALARHTASSWPHIGIVVASGQSRPGRNDLPEGAVFINKPFSAEVVHHHLRRVLTEDQTPGPLKNAGKRSC